MALFSDVVQGPGNTTAATAVALPDMTLPTSARMITRIWVTAALMNYNAAEPLSGYVEVKSEDCGIEPLHIPFEIVPGFLTVAQSVQREAHKWIVNCPCPAGTVLSFNSYVDTTLGVAHEVQVTVEFSDGGSPFPGPQLHMKSSEGIDALGTADNVATSLNDIEIKASRLIGVWGYALQTTVTADESCVTTVSVTSSDFSENGPFRFSFNPHGAGIANASSGGVDLTVIETDRGFNTPGSKQTVSCTVTVRDALTGNGKAGWGVIYY